MAMAVGELQGVWCGGGKVGLRRVPWWRKRSLQGPHSSGTTKKKEWESLMGRCF